MRAALLQSRLQQPCRLRLAVNQANRGMALEIVIPTQQIVLPTVRRQTADGMNSCLYRYGHSVDVDPACAVHQGSTERAGRLVSSEDDVAFGARQVVRQVMQNAPAVAHATAGDDQCMRTP